MGCDLIEFDLVTYYLMLTVTLLSDACYLKLANACKMIEIFSTCRATRSCCFEVLIELEL